MPSSPAHPASSSSSSSCGGPSSCSQPACSGSHSPAESPAPASPSAGTAASPAPAGKTGSSVCTHSSPPPGQWDIRQFVTSKMANGYFMNQRGNREKKMIQQALHNLTTRGQHMLMNENRNPMESLHYCKSAHQPDCLDRLNMVCGCIPWLGALSFNWKNQLDWQTKTGLQKTKYMWGADLTSFANYSEWMKEWRQIERRTTENKNICDWTKSWLGWGLNTLVNNPSDFNH